MFYNKKTNEYVAKMKYLLILISGLFFLSSCDKPVYHNIPKNEKPLLKDNDTAVFIDRINNKSDSFLIRRTDDYRVSDKRYYQEYIDLFYHKIRGLSTFKEFIIQHSAATSISIDGDYFPTYGNADPISVTINGINYQSVFVRHAANFPDSIPNTIYYSHQCGIIRYNYSDGRCYELK